MSKTTRPAIALLALMLLATAALAQGPGRGQGRGFGRGPGHDGRHDEDRELFHFLLANHDKITRKVTELANGVETLTESEDLEIADKIKEHVYWMEQRIKKTQPIRMRDPLFRELFRHTDKIKMRHEDTEQGVRVIETSDDPYVARLIKAHAKTVSGFVKRGFAEAMKNHPVPDQEGPVEPATTRERDHRAKRTH